MNRRIFLFLLGGACIGAYMLTGDRVSAGGVPGDINDSGAVDAIDVQLVINEAIGINTPFDADVNADGNTNAVDVQLIINAALGIDISEQVEPPGTLATAYVDAANISGVEDGSELHPFDTLSEAAEAAKRDGKIFVKPGTYSGAITLRNGVTLVSTKGALFTRIEPNNDPAAILLSLKDGCIIRGFAIGETTGTAIRVLSDSSITLSNCVLHANGTALRADADATINVTNATVHGNTTGIRLESGAAASVKNCAFTSNATAVSATLGTWQGSYNGYSGNTTDLVGAQHAGTDVQAAPLYVDIAALNHHLRLTSPYRNAGDPTTSFNDLDGSRNDLGADGGPFGVRDLLAPRAIATADILEGDVPFTVNFDASASTDEWGIANYSWDFDTRNGLQTDASTATVQHTFTIPNGYITTLTITDNNGFTAQTTIALRAGNNLPSAAASSDPIAGPTPLQVQFTGTGSDPDSDPLTFDWEFGDGNGSTQQSPLHTYDTSNAPGPYRISLLVTDSHDGSVEARIPLTLTESAVLAAEIVNPDLGATLEVVGQPQSTLNGATVTIPADATSEPLVFTIGEVEETLPLPRGTFGTLLNQIEVGPTGMTFSVPVTITIPIPADTDLTRKPLALYFDRATDEWLTTGMTDIRFVTSPQKAIAFETTHFTPFAVGVAWSFRLLGTLGGSSSNGLGMNNNNEIAGYAYVFVASNDRHAFHWSPTTGIEDLGTLGRKHSYGFGINDAGQMTGYLQPGDNSFSGVTTFLYDPVNGMQNLGALGGIYSLAYDINASGQIVGQVYYTASQSSAFLWDPISGVLDLGTLGGTSSYALGINDAGHVVGSAQISNGDYHAFLWKPGTGMVDLGTLGGSTSQAEDLNESGVVVGAAWDSAEFRRAFRWDNTNGLEDLGVLDGEQSQAFSINSAGQIVGYVRYPDDTTRAFYWERENNVGTMYDLNNFANAGEENILAEAQAINDAGNIAGHTNEQAFFLRR